jgi:hypothetical protein
VRVPEGTTIGKNFVWRSYFHGGSADREESWRPAPGAHLARTTLSAVFRSQATQRWIVAVSAPVFDGARFLGVVALTVEVGRFVQLQSGNDQFAVLVDLREGEHQGLILQHPLFDRLLKERGTLDGRFQNYRLTAADLPDTRYRMDHYRDPLAADPDGGEYDRHWLAQMETIRVHGQPTGLVVIVQEAYDAAIGTTLDGLKEGLVRRGLTALSLIVLVMISLWWFATRLSVKH